MQLSLAILAVFVSAAAAAPTVKRQNFCPLQNLGSLSVTASADPNGKTRWDVFTVSSELIQVGDVAWFENNQPNGNEVFTATAGSAPGLFTFQRQGAQQIGVVGSSLAASNTPTTFLVSCSGCDAFASGNDLAANGCSMEETDGTNGTGQCVTFAAANSVVSLQACSPGSPAQNFGIFSVG
ncbi:hypothetical protein B0H10DRAFT_1956778 [Mycena sp. CBHHK59/15]|nr:hypothetical protein B0H10DRAFT_1956778 [Mycena sp. CBHHK59/15]